MWFRLDSHGSGERKIEVVSKSKVEATKGESCEKLHEQCGWTVLIGRKRRNIAMVPLVNAKEPQ